MGANNWSEWVPYYNFWLALRGSADQWLRSKLLVKDQKTWSTLKTLFKKESATQMDDLLYHPLPQEHLFATFRKYLQLPLQTDPDLPKVSSWTGEQNKSKADFLRMLWQNTLKTNSNVIKNLFCCKFSSAHLTDHCPTKPDPDHHQWCLQPCQHWIQRLNRQMNYGGWSNQCHCG